MKVQRCDHCGVTTDHDGSGGWVSASFVDEPETPSLTHIPTRYLLDFCSLSCAAGYFTAKAPTVAS